MARGIQSMRCKTMILLACAMVAGVAMAGENSADLRLRIAPNDVLTYVWNIKTISDSSGKEKEREFMLSADSTFGMTMTLRGLPVAPTKRKEGSSVSVKLKDQTYLDKRSIDKSKTELFISKGKMKYTQDGKAIIDSDNDIGLDKMGEYQEHFKTIENSEMRATLDSAGRQSEVLGDPAIVDSIRNGGAQGIFPILSGKDTAVGESWEDGFAMPQIGEFKLSQPLGVHSKISFTKWEEKGGRKLARIELVSAWENRDLHGESEQGMLVNITRVSGEGTGTCLFDPVSGRYVEGTLNFTMKYRIDGEKNGQKSGLDVSGKSQFNFVESK